MRIGFDASPITTRRTGVGNYCYFLLKHLLQLDRGHDFAAFSSGRADIDLADLAPYVGHRHLPVPTRLLYGLWNALGSPKVDRYLRGVDVYHATNYFLPPTQTARRVVTVHDLAFLTVPQYCSPKIVRPFARGIERFCSQADAVMVYSDSTKRDIVERLQIDPAKIVKAPMAVDEGFQPVPLPQALKKIEEYRVKPPYFLFVSTIEPRKNVIGLLRAFEELSRRLPHKLVLVGGMGWDADEFLMTLDALNLHNKVVFPGFIPHKELPALYCAAEAFLFPTHYEGFGLPLLEALTCGCPVITSNNSSVPEVTGDAALRTDSNDIDGFVELVLRLVGDQSLRSDLVEKGKVHAAKFSWRSCAEITMSVYEKLAP